VTIVTSPEQALEKLVATFGKQLKLPDLDILKLR